MFLLQVRLVGKSQCHSFKTGPFFCSIHGDERTVQTNGLVRFHRITLSHVCFHMKPLILSYGLSEEIKRGAVTETFLESFDVGFLQRSFTKTL